MEQRIEGLIIKSTGGLYQVQTAQRLIPCKARGVFRNREITPYVGDRVVVEHTADNKGYIVEIKPRKNHLIRPPLANLDRLIMVVSTTQPIPSTWVLDMLIAIAEYKEIEPVIVVSKSDLQEECTLAQRYQNAGFLAFPASVMTGEGIEQLREILSQGISGFCGNTGVGKSSLLNALDPSFLLETGEISKKLGRGRHTTRHVELYPMAGGGYIADTPGFSAIEAQRFAVIRKEELADCFREFAPYQGECQFHDCSHTKEKGCRVCQAVEEGKIARSRHDSYCRMYEAAKEIKEWEHR